MTWRWRRGRLRREIIAAATAPGPDRAVAADALVTSQHNLREVIAASHEIDRLAAQIRHALGVRK